MSKSNVFQAQPPPAITLENKSLETSIHSEADRQLSANPTCQSYLLTSISALSFTGQFPIFVSMDVSSTVPARRTDVEQSTLHTPVHLAPCPHLYLLLLPKTGCSPTPQIRSTTPHLSTPHGKFLLDTTLPDDWIVFSLLHWQKSKMLNSILTLNENTGRLQ